MGAALRRRAVEIAAPAVRAEGVAIPLFDGIRWVGQHHVKAHQAVDFDEFGFGQRVTALNAEILDAVQKTVQASI